MKLVWNFCKIKKKKQSANDTESIRVISNRWKCFCVYVFHHFNIVIGSVCLIIIAGYGCKLLLFLWLRWLNCGIKLWGIWMIVQSIWAALYYSDYYQSRERQKLFHFPDNFHQSKPPKRLRTIPISLCICIYVCICVFVVFIYFTVCFSYYGCVHLLHCPSLFLIF